MTGSMLIKFANDAQVGENYPKYVIINIQEVLSSG